MLGTRFWNFYMFKEYDYSLKYGSSHFHTYGEGWYEPDFNYYQVGNGYFEFFGDGVDVNCIYEIKKI